MNTIVVGHYREDTAWTADLPPGWRPLVVTKDVDVPNEGREPASYLWAIQRLRPRARPADVFAFVQGNPFDHCPDLLAELSAGATGFRWLGPPDHVSLFDGHPHHGGLPVRAKFEAWTGRDWPGQVAFAAGGQFIVTGAELRRHPPRFYRDLHAEMLVGEVPWVLERLWAAIFE